VIRVLFRRRGCILKGMNDVDVLCARCADQGIQEVLADVHSQDLEALARACSARADDAQQSGNDEQADRLRAAAQYLTYLMFPHD
jgi:hypothetical protein